MTRLFQHSVDTSRGLGALLSINRPSQNRRLMKTFVTIFWNQISSIFFPLLFPLISHSISATHVISSNLNVNLGVALDVQNQQGYQHAREGPYLHIPLKEAILGMLGLPFLAMAWVKVLRQELRFLLQHLLHRPVQNALRIH